ncbi:hypothetical protein COCON_G00089050, partial [Conger conger]
VSCQSWAKQKRRIVPKAIKPVQRIFKNLLQTRESLRRKKSTFSTSHSHRCYTGLALRFKVEPDFFFAEQEWLKATAAVQIRFHSDQLGDSETSFYCLYSFPSLVQGEHRGSERGRDGLRSKGISRDIPLARERSVLVKRE